MDSEDTFSEDSFFLQKLVEDKLKKDWSFSTFKSASSIEITNYFFKEKKAKHLISNMKNIKTEMLKYLAEKYPDDRRFCLEQMPAELSPSPSFFSLAPIASNESLNLTDYKRLLKSGLTDNGDLSSNKLIASKIEETARERKIPIENIVVTGFTLCPQKELPFLLSLFSYLKNYPKSDFCVPGKSKTGRVFEVPYSVYLERVYDSIYSVYLDKETKKIKYINENKTKNQLERLNKTRHKNDIQIIIHKIKQITFSWKNSITKESIAFSMFDFLRFNENTGVTTLTANKVLFDFFTDDKILKLNYLLFNAAKSRTESSILLYIEGLKGYVPKKMDCEKSDGRKIISGTLTLERLTKRIWPTTDFESKENISKIRKEKTITAMKRLRSANLIYFEEERISRKIVFKNIVSYLGMSTKQYLESFGDKNGKYKELDTEYKYKFKEKNQKKIKLDGNVSIEAYLSKNKISAGENKIEYAKKHLEKMIHIIETAKSKNLTVADSFNGVEKREYEKLQRLANKLTENKDQTKEDKELRDKFTTIIDELKIKRKEYMMERKIKSKMKDKK